MKSDLSARKSKKYKRVFIIGSLLLVLMFFVSMNAGYTNISLPNLFRILSGGGTAKENLVVFDFRLPRILLAIIVGIGFSLSGCILQGITKNPLADPGIMGINAGAGLVVVLFMTLSGTLTSGMTFSLPVFSLLGALLTSAVIYLLSYHKTAGVQPVRLVLNGVAIQAGINALMTVIVLKLDDNQYDMIAVWQAGSIYNSEWKSVWSLLPWIAAGFLYILFKSKEMDVLEAGDAMAVGLGVKLGTEKKKLLFTAVALAAASVTVGGSLHFVGLIGPHLARKLVGARHKILVPVSAVTGALLVLTADTIGRTIIEPSEIPAGIIAAIIGAPYFIFLLIGSRPNKPTRR